ncbi:hypothetical protein [Streptomyces sp. JJ38]|uniref:hypothetical protein n=1 Tax=Streptomyces sp. JJ38 TaxID=2738128 RepID=UPI001C587F16|nr:hypothetical protein [Streptomyces sp. JJ38]MBW1596352.1 hypothetical protein [Streptomyces sp. JJ38]
MTAESPQPPRKPQEQLGERQNGRSAGDELADRLRKLAEEITEHLERLRKK